MTLTKTLRMNPNPTLTLTDGTILHFNKIYEELFPSLVAYAKRLLYDTGACEMLAQDAFLALWAHPFQFSSRFSINVFLHTVVHRKALNILQRIKIENSYLDTVWEEEDAFVCHTILPEEEFDELFRLSQAIEQLPEYYQNICQLILEDKNNQDIADQLNITVNTVKYHKKNIYKLLREKLQPPPQ